MTVLVGTDSAKTRRSLTVAGKELRLLFDRGGRSGRSGRFQPLAGVA